MAGWQCNHISAWQLVAPVACSARCVAPTPNPTHVCFQSRRRVSTHPRGLATHRPLHAQLLPGPATGKSGRVIARASQPSIHPHTPRTCPSALSTAAGGPSAMDATRPGGSSLPISSATRGPWLGWAMRAASTSADAVLAASACSARAEVGASPPGQGQLQPCRQTGKQASRHVEPVMSKRSQMQPFAADLLQAALGLQPSWAHTCQDD